MDVIYEKPEHMPYYELEKMICERAINDKKYAPEEIADALVAQLDIAREAVQKARQIIEDWNGY